MGGGAVGGDPAQISASGAALIAAASAIGQTSAGLTRAGSTGCAAADSPVSAAISRFAAASSQLSTDLDTQLRVAGLLANNGGADLATATGTGPGSSPPGGRVPN